MSAGFGDPATLERGADNASAHRLGRSQYRLLVTVEEAFKNLKGDVAIRPIFHQLEALVGFDFAPKLRQDFHKETSSWLNKIQRLGMKPTNRTGSVKFSFHHLFDYPFGRNEVQPMEAMMKFICSEYDNIAPIKSPEEVISSLKEFHAKLAQRLHNGEVVLDLVPE